MVCSQPQAQCSLEPWNIQLEDISQCIQFNISHFAEMPPIIVSLRGLSRTEINLPHKGEQDVLQVKTKSNCIQLKESSMNLVLCEIIKVQRHEKVTTTQFLTLRNSPASEKTSHKPIRKTQYDAQYKMRQEARTKPETSPNLEKLEPDLEKAIISHQEEQRRKGTSSCGNNICSGIEVLKA